jgi:hypothetical protein
MNKVLKTKEYEQMESRLKLAKEEYDKTKDPVIMGWIRALEWVLRETPKKLGAKAYGTN